MFDRGVIELIEYFLDEKRNYVREKMASTTINSDSIDMNNSNNMKSDNNSSSIDPLNLAIDHHLTYLLPYRKHHATLLSHMIHPQHLDTCVYMGYKTADDLCQFRQIHAHRMDWYAERALVAGYMAAVELYMLTDQSENLAETRYVCIYL